MKLKKYQSKNLFNNLKLKGSMVLLLGVLFSFCATAQTQVNLHVHHKLDGPDFAFNQMGTTDQNTDFQLTRMEYYLSNITIIHDGNMQTPVSDSVMFLIGAEKTFKESLGSYNVTNVEGIKFSVGVDTPFNQSDPVDWPTGHPLAPRPLPAKQMNWSWPAGYRFAAMEGYIGSNTANTFQIHSLENQYYYEQTVMVNGVQNGGEIDINIEAEIAKALNGIAIVDGANQGITEHGSSPVNIKLLENFRDHVFGPGSPLSVDDKVSKVQFKMFPNPTNGIVNIQYDNSLTGITDIHVSDITGREVLRKNIVGLNAAQVELPESGMYMISLSKNGIRLSQGQLVVKY